jgi:hypothetical protein
MPKYRIIKSTGRSSQPSAIWIEKLTDQDAIAAARECLGPRDSAEVWGERDFVARLEWTTKGRVGGRLGRWGRSLAGRPFGRHLVAGLVTTTGIALVLGSLNSRGLDPAPATKAAPITVSAVSYAPSPGSVSVQGPDVEVAEMPEVQTPPASASAKPRLHQARRGTAASGVRPKKEGRLFPAATRPQTNVYTMMTASGFSQGGN